MSSSTVKNVRKNILLALGNHLLMKKIEGCFDSSDSSSSEDGVDPVLQILMVLSQTRYLQVREPIHKSSSNLDICLYHYKTSRPDIFRQEVRMYPQTFDLLVLQLAKMSVFYNQDGPPQIAVEKQVLITLRQLGSYGNGVSLEKCSHWAGVGKGTIELITRRVLVAIHTSTLREDHVRWPPLGPEREEAKQWVEDRANSVLWRDGWCMIAGTFVPIYTKPHYFGESWYDRKSNYSMNVQIINTPNLKIIDYASGFVGSRHDSHCVHFTRLVQERARLLEPGEWCWGDAGYPLNKWLIIPYKRPDSERRDNRIFNTPLSRIRIKSEHAIGYLKGRWQSLKSLRIQINNKKDVTYAMAWVNACIILHAFCQDDELEVNQIWLNEGRAFDQENQRREEDHAVNNQIFARREALRVGQKARIALKRNLFSD